MIAIPPEAIRAAFEDFLKEVWGLEPKAALELAKRPLKQKALEVREEILRTAIDVHPLYPITRYILDDFVEHAAAIDMFGKSKAALLNVRHVEELYTVSKYLIGQSDRYDEFAWRWNNFQTLHTIRNRILNLKEPLSEEMTGWLNANIDRLKKYFSKKFEVDPAKCAEQWERLSNWLDRVPLKEIFEKAGRLQSYTSAAYDWNSQAVHVSPLGDVYMGYVLKHHDYGEFALESATTFIHKMCHECLPLVHCNV